MNKKWTKFAYIGIVPIEADKQKRLSEKFTKIVNGMPRYTAEDLSAFHMANAIYAEKMNAFRNAKDQKNVTTLGMPNYKKILKQAKIDVATKKKG